MITYKSDLSAQLYIIPVANPKITQIRKDGDVKPTICRYNISFLTSSKNLQNTTPKLQYLTNEESPVLQHFYHSKLGLSSSQTEKMLSITNIGSPIFLAILLRFLYIRFLSIWHNKQSSKEQSQKNYNQQLEFPISYEQLQKRYEEINHKNQLLQQLLTEKECLLKEIHHRVKNNLQVVMSLLESQADSLQDKAALSAIQESQHRVQAIVLIHQKLYQTESLARIPLNSYIEEVVAYLSDSYSLYQPIRFDLHVEDIELDVTLAVPLGLIINEAITNAFKYAYPDHRSGIISLKLHRLEEASYQLIISDDGVGLPASYDPSRSRSLGMTLIHGFSRQLGAKLAITSPPGMCISLIFQEEQLVQTHSNAQYV
jgi:two-component sensor histidine kinase